jgi:hypothetical protein
MLGGLVATRFDGGARSGGGLALLLLALTVGHASLGAVAASTLGMAAVLLLAGATIAPTEASVYAMVEHVAPAGTLTEAFAWLATAAALGASLGAATGGSPRASGRSLPSASPAARACLPCWRQPLGRLPCPARRAAARKPRRPLRRRADGLRIR